MASGIQGPINITVNGQPLENVHDSKYLASGISVDASSTAKIISWFYGNVKNDWIGEIIGKSWYKTFGQNKLLFYMLIVSIVLCGYEYWTLTINLIYQGT